MTFGFVTVILGVTDKRASAFAAAVPLAIGLTRTLIHLIGIPVTNTSVIPARSTAPALFVGGSALSQLWLFWVAPRRAVRSRASPMGCSAARSELTTPANRHMLPCWEGPK